MATDILKQKKIFIALLVVVAIVVAWYVLRPSLIINPMSGRVGVTEISSQSLSAPAYFASDVVVKSGSRGFVIDGGPSLLGDTNVEDRKITKNGSLSLIVEDADIVADDIQSLAERLGGFVSNVNIYEVSADTKSGSINIRVPADKFDDAIGEIKKLAIKVENENVGTRDVTEQFVDLEARLKNLRAEEGQYVLIMKDAENVEEILKVTDYLSRVRSSIERYEGQFNYLSRQIDMSAISVSLMEEADIEVFGIRWRPLFVVKQAFRNMLTGFTGYADSVIGFIFYIPVLIIWGISISIIVYVVWKIYLWIYGKFI